MQHYPYRQMLKRIIIKVSKELIKKYEFQTHIIQRSLYLIVSYSQAFLRPFFKAININPLFRPLLDYLIEGFSNTFIFCPMVTSHLKIALVVIAMILGLTYCQQYTKASTVVCRSQCRLFRSNSPTFKDGFQAARNLSNLVYNANNHLDVLKGFNNYQGSFKTLQMNNLLAFKQLKNFHRILINTYGQQAVNQYALNRLADSPCQSSSSGSGGITAFPGMFDNLHLPANIEEIHSDYEGVYFPIKMIPDFPGPETHNPFQTELILELLCVNAVMQSYMNILPNPNIKSNKDTFTKFVASVPNEQTAGQASMYLNVRFGEEMAETYLNCLRDIYNDC